MCTGGGGAILYRNVSQPIRSILHQSLHTDSFVIMTYLSGIVMSPWMLLMNTVA